MTDLQTRTIAYLLSLVILFSAGIFGYLIGGFSLLIPLVISLLLAFLILEPILRPAQGIIRVRLMALVIFGEVSTIILRGESWIILLLNLVLKEVGFPPIQMTEPNDQAILLAIFGIILIALIWLFEKQQILPSAPTMSEEESPSQESDYKELRDRFCSFMATTYLSRIDEETNWSDCYYSTLETEIEMTHQRGKSSRVVSDLINAIRSDKASRSFLLIGDPGSGKSVSLRRLARELYKEVQDQGVKAVVPVYVNLKEWKGPKKPTDKDINKFSFQFLKRISGRAGKVFLQKYYEKMLSQGLLFFIFDSFDEMPMVLDCDDRSDQLKKISLSFDTFFSDLHQCRGILSSRPFRKPNNFQGRRLIIRPFSEKQIRSAMKKWLLGEGFDSDQIVRRLFIEKPHLSPALRNPFMSDLIAQYLIHYRDKLPDTYFDLFEHYINNRFEEDIENLEELGLTKSGVLETAVIVAQTIYNSPDIGLEIDIDALRQQIDDSQLEDKIIALKKSRIVRWGGSRNERFSFVHRRFAEFFAVSALLKNSEMVNRSAIPTDSRWRDGLVVYCGVAPKQEVCRLTEFAWETIQRDINALTSGNIKDARTAIHCLRFLRDSCQSRPEGIASFQKALSQLILDLLRGKDLLAAKIAIETLSLVTPEVRTYCIAEAFNRDISWLSETALRACRHLPQLEDEAVRSIYLYIKRLPTRIFISSFKDLDFALSLSDSLQKIRLVNRLDMLLLVIRWAATIIITIFSLVRLNSSSISYYLFIPVLAIYLEIYALPISLENIVMIGSYAFFQV